eukprot:7777437-Pyramimonas_sp.AAC.1
MVKTNSSQPVREHVFANEVRVDPKGGPATRGWRNRFGTIDLRGCSTSGACHPMRGASVLLESRVQDTICSAMQ